MDESGDTEEMGEEGEEAVDDDNDNNDGDEDEEEEEEEDNENEDEAEGEGMEEEDVGEEEEEEEEGDDDEADWSDVDEEEDDEEEESGETMVSTASSPSPSVHLDRTRMLTNEDFALITKLKAAYAERIRDPRFRTKKFTSVASRGASGAASRGGDEEDDNDGDGQENTPRFTVDPDSLGSTVRSEKATKIERIASILQGRSDKRFEHGGHAGGLTNKEKQRKKNYVMVRKGKASVANKIRTSNSDARYKKMKKKEQYGRDRRKRRRT